jgi:DNA-binding CsgD family transcriptional regulator
LKGRPLSISICIDSEVFVRGLLGAFDEIPELETQIITHEPDRVREAIDQGTDILVLDQKLADQVTPQLPGHNSPPRILLVSERRHIGVEQPDQLHHACGFFPVRASEKQLKTFIRTLVECTRQGPCKKVCSQCPVFGTRQPRELPLTPRETEIFQLIGQLYGNSEIAEALGISIKTVEAHCANIKTKLELDSSKALLKAAIDWVEGR